jgi:hypothetical protein
VVEGLQNDTVILHTPAEAVLKEILVGTYERPRFQWRDWYSWITLLPLIAIPVLAVTQYKLFVRLRAITTISAIGMSLLQKAHAYAILTPPPTVAPTPQWMAVLADIRRLDFTLLFWLAFITGAVIMAFVCIVQIAARRTFLYLDIVSASAVVQIHFATLPDPTRNFTVKMSKGLTRLALKNFYFFGIITFQTKPWRIVYTLEGRRVRLSSYVFIPFWQLKEVRKVLTADHKVTPLIVDTHEYVFPDAGQMAERKEPPSYADSRF